jgi:hypothetical protein
MEAPEWSFWADRKHAVAAGRRCGSLTARSPAEAMSRQKCRFDGWEIACQFASEELKIAWDQSAGSLC